jgi:serine protease Do
MPKHFRVFLSTATFFTLFGFALGNQVLKSPPLLNDAQASPSTVSVSSPLSFPAQTNSENFRAVVHKVGPSVLTIKATQRKPPRSFSRRGDLPDGSLEEMLRRFGFGLETPAQSAPQQASGSSFVLDKAGHLLTNYHVVKDASEISVLLDNEEEEISATLVGSDPRTDLAVLKIAPVAGLVPIEWADSQSIEVGDAAVAIGSPYNLTHSVTAGIVSAKGRNASALLGASLGYELIQTDAAINPGNSGGPLCTADGKVMGVNTAIFTQSGGSMGIGFAIPSNLAQKVAAALIQDGKIVRGWLGVVIEKANRELRKELDLPSAVVVHEVQENSPAENAGLHAGDVIVEVAGKKIAQIPDVQNLITGFHPGEKISLKLIRYQDRQTRTVEVQIGKLPDLKT